MTLAWVLAGWAASAWAAGGGFEEGLALKRAEKFAEAAAVFAAVVKKEPRNADALEQLATVQGWLGRHEESIETWRRLLRLAPKNDDYRVGLARVLYWKGRHEEALKELSRVLAGRSRRADALALRGDVLAAAGRPEEARTAYLGAQSADPSDGELAKKLARLEFPLRWRVDSGLVYDHYTNFRRAERGTYLQAGYAPRPGRSVWLRHEWQNHFRFVDNTIAAGGAWQPARPLTLTGEVGGTPASDFSADFKAAVGGELRVHAKAAVLAGYRYLAYGNGSLHSFVPGLRFEAVPWASFEYKLVYSRNVDDSTTAAHLFRLGFSWAERVLPYVGFASGEEAVPPQPKARSNDVSAGVVWNVSRAWALRADVSNEHRPGFYERNTVAGGLTYRF